MTDTQALSHPSFPGLELLVADAGRGRPILILHGGGGPMTVASIAAHLTPTALTLTPTHPGWNGTARPEGLTRINDLAQLYLDYLDARQLSDVLIIGSSIGGWIASEMALRDTADLITSLILIDAVGIEVPGEPIRDFFGLDARGVAEYAWHDSQRFYTDPATVPAEQLARQQANMATMRVFAGNPYMHDPALMGQLHHVQVPTLVLWGESDRIVTQSYGAAFAAALGQARFEVIAQAGHLPHLEQPDATLALIDEFVQAQPTRPD